MRKIVVILVIASLLSLTFAAPVWAFPVAALVIPAVIGTLINLAATVPARYDYAGPQAAETYYPPEAYYAPRVYAPPRYYAPRAFAAPRYYASRVYAPPTRYYTRRAFAAPRYYAPRVYTPPTRYYARRAY